MSSDVAHRFEAGAHLLAIRKTLRRLSSSSLRMECGCIVVWGSVCPAQPDGCQGPAHHSPSAGGRAREGDRQRGPSGTVATDCCAAASARTAVPRESRAVTSVA